MRIRGRTPTDRFPAGGNSWPDHDDYLPMNCDASREAISARLDGELPGGDAAALDAHLGACAACRAFAGEVAELHRAVRVRPAEEVPDLSAAILAATAASAPAPTTLVGATGGRAVPWLRYALTVIGLTLFVLAVPSLVLHDAGASIHQTRELSAWDLAFGAGLLVVAWQPARARGLLPMAAVLAAGLVLGSVIDVAAGRAPALSEAHHVLELAGVGLVWLVCRAVSTDRSLPRPRPARGQTGRHLGWHPA